jgi:hypothetical protein
MRIAVACAIAAGCSSTPTVELVLQAQPETVSFKPDGADWTTVDLLTRSDRSATYAIPDEDGTIAVACTQPNGLEQVEELFATAADYQLELYSYLAPWPQLNCTPPETGPRVEITGTIDEGGVAWAGSATFFGVGPWQFEGSVTQGVHDLVVWSLTTVLIRHDQVMFEPVDEGSISLADDGLSVGTVMLDQYVDTDEYIYCGSDGMSACITTQLITANGTTATLGEGNDVAYYFPSEVLEPGDRQAVTLFGRYQPPNPPELAAFIDPNQPLTSFGQQMDIAPPSNFAFSSDEVSVDYGNVIVDLPITDFRVQYATPDVSLAATATAGWRMKHGSHVTFDTSFPGFRWPIVPGLAEHAFTVADRGSATIVLEATSLDP